MLTNNDAILLDIRRNTWADWGAPTVDIDYCSKFDFQFREQKIAIFKTQAESVFPGIGSSQSYACIVYLWEISSPNAVGLFRSR